MRTQKHIRLTRILALLWVLCLLPMCGCGSAPRGGQEVPYVFVPSGDSFSVIDERGFEQTAAQPSSAFALNTSRSSYSYMRRCVGSWQLPTPDSVRIEEYINYFDYDDARPPQNGDFSTVAKVFDCPWNGQNKLLRVTYRARDEKRQSVPNNLVFLADVSASMYGDDRIGLFRAAMTYVAQSLGENDTVSLVAYAGGCEVILNGVSGNDPDAIIDGVDSLQIGGSTYGSGAIELAYELAKTHFKAGGNNRIILFTDGDFNVGVSHSDALADLIADKRAEGIYFTAVGVGYGNYKDTVMESLAKAGNGEAYYLDNASEARRVFGENLTGTLTTVASEARARVTFYPEQVAQYRLLGYDNRTLTDVQFEDEQTNAGEIGAGRQVTALYEITLADTCDTSAPLASAELRYRVPDSAQTQTLIEPIGIQQPNHNDAFIACVAEFGLLLRNSAYAPDARFTAVLDRLEGLPLNDVYKEEFHYLVGMATERFRGDARYE